MCRHANMHTPPTPPKKSLCSIACAQHLLGTCLCHLYIGVEPVRVMNSWVCYLTYRDEATRLEQDTWEHRTQLVNFACVWMHMRIMSVWDNVSLLAWLNTKSMLLYSLQPRNSFYKMLAFKKEQGFCPFTEVDTFSHPIVYNTQIWAWWPCHCVTILKGQEVYILLKYQIVWICFSALTLQRMGQQILCGVPVKIF